MARDAGTDPSESLELFLDTISNVFGGVLFVAMLVVLLLQVTPEARLDAEAAQTRDPAERTDALPAEERLALSALLDRQGDLEAKVKAATEAIEAANRRNAEAVEEQRATRARIAEARRLAAEARAAIAAAESKRDGVVRLPRFRATQKREVPLVISGGRVAAVFEYDAEGRATAVNEAAVEVVEEGRRVRPRAGQGVAVTRESAAAVARQVTRGASPESHFVALGVWPDSFAEASWLREALSAAGFEHGLVPVPGGGTIALGGEGGVQ